MRCDYYEADLCRSCTIIETPYSRQVADKQRRVEQLIVDFAPQVTWLPPVLSPEAGFRTKAKMVVAGTTDQPTVGILDAHGQGQDLRDCPLYPAPLAQAFPHLTEFITRARLEPYSVPQRRGELKNVLVTLAPDGALMVRWVLRSTEALARIRKHLPWLQVRLPSLAVASVNVLADHKAVVEGDHEIMLTERETLTMTVNGIDLHLRPQSFFQTNTDVAAALYAQAAEWVTDIDPPALWDLYCGVGGFALHGAHAGRSVVGVESSAQAVASAQRTRDERLAAGDHAMETVEFIAADAPAWARDQPHDSAATVVVNPPRRGLGEELSRWLEESAAPAVIYSSCNPQSLARDLAWMPSLTVREARLFDMFPHTTHGEVAVLLTRR